MATNELQPLDVNEAEEVLETKPNEVKAKLREEPEVRRLAEQIDYKNQLALLEYGKETANEISSFSGKVLSTIKSSSMEESSQLLKRLGKIMDKFDAKDFVEDKGFFSKLFKRGQKIVDKLFQKYETMGSEIDKVYVEITKYETEMKHSTTTLEQLYEQNYQYYMELEKYIVAGEVKVEELKQELKVLEERASSGNQLAAMELQTLKNAVELMGGDYMIQKWQNKYLINLLLKSVSLRRGNTKLIGKINSAFITTIPIFKNGLINAIMTKRQNLVAESMNELDKRTNELLIRNAENISQQSVKIAKMSGAPSVKVETMEQTWNIIMKGMQETKAIEEENKRLREEGFVRLEQFQENFKALEHRM